MINLGYIVKNNENPKGKPRIWFCATALDYKFLRGVADELFEETNSVIYYDKNVENATLSDDVSLLSEINLFVMPVTKSLLTTENRAILVEFKYAVENNIPVLPIVFDKGLDELYYEKCGNLQYLDKASKDDTAISFSEKLKKYLSKVILGDDTYEKVRSAFDAYIFLSYRKKDRIKAKELMSLIHRNDFCRDIAIWYDEFLTPGEDFNDSIAQALNKSELFVMAVTPNVVNEENYVMKVEYPEAVKAGKKIIPARLEDVNEIELKSKYEGIDDSFDARNAKLLSERLSNALKDVALLVNDNDPVHNYFIGLAYLYGIDVEINNEMALRLIEKSAEGNLETAIEKLSEMYYNGEGVKADVHKAIEYKIKSVKAYYNKFKKEKLVDNLDKFCEEMRELSNYFNRINENEKSKNVDEALLNALKNFSCKEDENIVKRLLASAYERFGDNLSCIGKELSVINVETAVKLREEIYNSTNKISDKRYLCSAYSSLADIYFNMNMFDKIDRDKWDENGNRLDYFTATGKESEALELAKKVVKLREEIASESDAVNDKCNLYYAYNKLFYAYISAMEHLEYSEELFLGKLEARKNAEKVGLSFEGYKSERANAILASVYNSIASRLSSEKKYDVAHQVLVKRLNVVKKTYQKTPTVDNLFDVASAYFSLVQSANFLKNYEEAVLYGEKEILAREEINDILKSNQSISDLASTYYFHALNLSKTGNKNGFNVYFEKYDNLERVAINEITNEEEKLGKLFGYYGVAIDNCLKEKNVDGIYFYFEKYQETIDKIIEIQPFNKFNMTNFLGVACKNIGEKCLEIDVIDDGEFHEENLDLPIYFYEKSIEILNKCLTNSSKQNVAIAQINLSNTYLLLGEAYNYKGDEETLKKYINTAISILESAYENWISVCKSEYKNANCLYELIKTLSNYGWAFDTETGAKMTIRARDLLSGILEKFPTDEKFSKKHKELVDYVNKYYSEYDN